jgi:DNA-binding MarR family transcriptional regulator
LTAPIGKVRTHLPVHGVWSASESVIENVARLCRSAAGGRHAARALAEWTRPFELSEAEFQVLWQLRSTADAGRDQTTLAGELGFSPAQVSATVERLRTRLLILKQTVPGDRRRHFWQLSAGGRKLLDQMLYAAAQLRCDEISERKGQSAQPAREAAA